MQNGRVRGLTIRGSEVERREPQPQRINPQVWSQRPVNACPACPRPPRGSRKNQQKQTSEGLFLAARSRGAAPSSPHLGQALISTAGRRLAAGKKQNAATETTETLFDSDFDV